MVQHRFYLNGEYRRGYITSEYTTRKQSQIIHQIIILKIILRHRIFASYRESLRQLHSAYPLWVFVADHNGRDWDTMVNAQNVLGRSLIYSSADASWKSTADGCYD